MSATVLPPRNGSRATHSRSAAQKAIAGLNLEASNRELAEHWLSLWDGDALPPRGTFNPARLKSFLPGIMLFDVVPDRSVKVRLAGTGYRFVLERDPTDEDWIAAAPESHRAARLHSFSVIARGAVLVAHRRVAMLNDGEHISEEILVPFAPDANGVVTLLCRVNFKAEDFRHIKSMPQVLGDPLDVILVPFTN